MLDDHRSDRLAKEREIETILVSDDTPIGKVQRIVLLGYEEEVADEMVERYEIGQAAPLYYERLDYYDSN